MAGETPYIPTELSNITQWIHTYKDNPRRPVGGPTAKGYSLEYLKLKRKSQGWGFLSTTSDPYIIIDFDDVIDEQGIIVPQVVDFLKAHPTYTTWSISGTGLHAVYKTDINKFEYKKYMVWHFKEGKQIVAKGEVRCSNCFTLFAENHKQLKHRHEAIADISADTLREVFKFTPFSKTPPGEMREITGNVSVSQLDDMLSVLPLNQNERIQRAYKIVMDEDYSHYNYWLYIGMAVHDLGTIKNKEGPCKYKYLEWSKKDPTSYISQDDVFETWKSFSTKDTPITYRTLYAFYNQLRIYWPDMIVRKHSTTPDHTSYRNVQALIKHNDLRLKQDAFQPSVFTIAGYKDILQKYFYTPNYYQRIHELGELRLPKQLLHDEVFMGVAHLIRDSEIHKARHQTIKEAILEVINKSETYNPLKDEIEKRKPNFSKDTWLDVANTITIKDRYAENQRLYKLLIRFFLMQLVKNFYYRGGFLRDAGILVLIGGESIFKTTWVENLLPTPYNAMYVARNDSVFDSRGIDKDIKLIMKQKVIINFDEFEIYLQSKAAVSQLKAFMTGEYDTVRGIYERSPKTFKRRAVLAGTSNSNTLPFPQKGIRRYWCLPCSHCDTTKLAKIDLFQVYANLKAELEAYPVNEQHLLWNPPSAIKDFTKVNARYFKHADKLEEQLDLLYDWSAPWEEHRIKGKSLRTDDDPVFKTPQTIVAELEDNIPGFNVQKISNLKKELNTLLVIKCGDYTRTALKSKKLKRRPKGTTIKKGRASYGNYRRWCMPPIKEVYSDGQKYTVKINKPEKEMIDEEITHMNRQNRLYGLPDVLPSA